MDGEHFPVLETFSDMVLPPAERTHLAAAVKLLGRLAHYLADPVPDPAEAAQLLRNIQTFNDLLPADWCKAERKRINEIHPQRLHVR